MGVTASEFYDERRVAIVPMGFCFPGHDAKGGDLPPRRECAEAWRARVLAHLPQIEVILLVGLYAQRWHLGAAARASLTETVRDWRRIAERPGKPVRVPLPHPSWRNNAWLAANPWFEKELLARLKRWVRDALARD
jgi:uracil-DNA glycosylase